MQKADTEKEKKKARYFSVRGLRRCSNACCAVFHNRDYNAAINIGIRCKGELYSRKDTTAHMEKDEMDEELFEATGGD